MKNENWKTVRLGDVCEIQSGGTPSRSKVEYWKGGTIPWVKIGDFTGKYLSKSSEFITEEGLNNSSTKLFTKGTVLYSIFATLGEVAILDIDATTNQAIAGLKIIDNEKLNTDYFYSYLKSLKDEVCQIGRGVAQSNINLSILRDFKIPLPPLEEQKHIAAVLDKCTEVIAKHKLMLEKYDTLVKSQFVEMFGDNPIENGKWKVEKLGNLGLCKNGMNFSYEDNGFEINCLGVGDFKDNAVISNCEKLPVISLNEKPSEEYLLKDNDIVFVRSNGNKELVGRSVLVHPRVLTTFSGFCIRFRLSTDSINHLFLLQFLKMSNTRKNMAGRGANIQNLNQQILSNLDIPVPQIELQNDFASFVQQIDKSKFAVQKSLDKAETLYKALMQEYFGA